MFFLNPTYLWALLGLLVPIAIHLWSKKEGKTIKIGSIKLLEESDSKQSRSIQLNEFFLLVVRMLLIGILVLLMAGFQIKKKAAIIPVTYIVEPSLLDDDRIQTIIDIIDAGASLRLLEFGFPELDTDQIDIESNTTPNYWQLAKEMEALQTDSIVVFTNAFISGIKGRRPNTNKNIAWISLDSEASVKKNLKVLKKEDALQVLSMISNQDQLFFNKALIAADDKRLKFNKANDSVMLMLNGKEESVSLTSEMPTKVLLFYEDSLVNQKTYIEASLKAISKYLNRQIDIETVQSIEGLDADAFDLVVWLSSNVVPNTPTKMLVYQPDNLTNNIIEAGSSNRIFYLTEVLNTQNSIDRNLSEQLLKLFDFHKDVKNEINEYDIRTIDISELQPIMASLEAGKKQFELFDISKWLWLLMGTLLVMERIIAKFRKQ
ncbi:BatA domain-containing protein [Aquimarina sp. MMG016]|uniref:BatA domain-containing protein n=1 Tax=Aquimarina sp. MMG016 TaxID=2822690 RepID=UPI001B39F18D|nr:BatA domain-containing protein [Aquimarina sp. MMG016]MBQ4821684.1 BatA domain-containing protein [Aquimarina sp. MMG016]